MTARRKTPEELFDLRRAPASTPEALENQLILEAMDLAARQLREGTASAQVVTHFLKLGSSRERLEQARLSGEVNLIDKKIETMASGARMEELYGEAIKAMRAYGGKDPLPEDTYEEDEYYD